MSTTHTAPPATIGGPKVAEPPADQSGAPQVEPHNRVVLQSGAAVSVAGGGEHVSGGVVDDWAAAGPDTAPGACRAVEGLRTGAAGRYADDVAVVDGAVAVTATHRHVDEAAVQGQGSSLLLSVPVKSRDVDRGVELLCA